MRAHFFSLCFSSSSSLFFLLATFQIFYSAHVILFTFQRPVSLLKDDADSVNDGVVEYVLPPLHV